MSKDRMHETHGEAAREEAEENLVFNDVTDHMNRIVGVPSRRADLGAMPAALRWFFYFVMTIIALFAVLLIVSIVK
ncbi:hypothetical protein [Cohnella rhizosphaerae]|uniref:Uncharacterized protein n=1 Tax=Cohnella rhizosphaerae TaxID=1457232 RepID=A0A9X4KPY3_9BACL|nr:hypothetical protein [Cohnella rhizosphaerae]MDG0808954.1 hypothetical protein [Cohnella rhizosphaerae]